MRDRCSLSSGDYSDKVDHVAGRSEARTVPVEHWSFFCTVDNVMPSWIRPMVVQTSKFFLSDEREAVEMPLCGENDRITSGIRKRKMILLTSTSATVSAHLSIMGNASVHLLK